MPARPGRLNPAILLATAAAGTGCLLLFPIHHPPAPVSSGLDCPEAVPATTPDGGVKVLILGPQYPDSTAIAQQLQGMLDGDQATQGSTVVSQTIDLPADGGFPLGGWSLMYFFYDPDSRASRLANLGEDWTYIVLLEQTEYAVDYPEFYFEGVRILGCNARAKGATPIVLMSWSQDAQDTDQRGEIAYRVANGTRSVVAPAGYAWAATHPDGGDPAGRDLFVAAATLYSTLTGRDATGTGYVPTYIPSAEASGLTAAAAQSVGTEAGRVHYEGPYSGVVQMRSMPAGGSLAYMSYGTSSEALWQDNMKTILPIAGITPSPTELGAPEGSPFCESACLTAATPQLEKQQYGIFYAREYTVDGGTLEAIGPQTDMQVQVWDRHADNIPADGTEAVEMMEDMSLGTYDEARALGLAQTPYHLMFSKLKTMIPSEPLTSDGTHATPTVAYGQATMSIVARTGIHVATTGLDGGFALSAGLADETIRQLATLSITGTFVPDTPSAPLSIR